MGDWLSVRALPLSSALGTVLGAGLVFEVGRDEGLGDLFAASTVVRTAVDCRLLDVQRRLRFRHLCLQPLSTDGSRVLGRSSVGTAVEVLGVLEVLCEGPCILIGYDCALRDRGIGSELMVEIVRRWGGGRFYRLCIHLFYLFRANLI